MQIVFSVTEKGLATGGTAGVYSFAATESSEAWDLDEVSMGVFQQALENIAYLRMLAEAKMSLTFCR